jgi:GT2 family glycosyltransferase
MTLPGFTVVVCTRNRPGQLDATLAALRRQSQPGFDILVVDQSDAADPGLDRRALSDHRLTVVRDSGRGLSRSRNIAWRLVATDWVVFLDDDCVPEPEWAEALAEDLERHPEVGVVSGHVGATTPPGCAADGDYLTVSAFPVDTERVLGGRWTRPWDIGLGVCMALRRADVERLGGWDENLGAGARPFPAADDMDFNYRFLKAGGLALVTPRPRASHEQWRMPDELGPLYRGYMAAWAGFAMKHLRQGDVVGGLWLWSLGVADLARMAASAGRRCSLLRLRVAGYKAQGLVSGTARGLAHRW